MKWLRAPVMPFRSAAQYTRRQLPSLGKHAMARGLSPVQAFQHPLIPPHSEPLPPVQTLAARRPSRYGRRLSKLMVGARERARGGRVILHDVAEELKAKDQGSLVGRFKRVLAEYGRVALLFHATTATSMFGICYAALALGDAELVMRHMPQAVADSISPELGNIALAFIMTECTGLPRCATTIVVAPLIAEKIRYTRAGALLGLKAISKRGMSMSFLPGRHPRHSSLSTNLSKALF